MSEKKVLLVEDREHDVELTLRAFSKSDLPSKIIVARDGQEAIDTLFSMPVHELPDLVLLDLKLPRIDGLEVLKCLRANESTKALPVVVLTSSKRHEDVVSCYRCGANSYIQKPVDFIRFTEVLQQLGTYWLFLNESPAESSN